MKCIIGLGNPGNKYEGTRHNIGFDIIDYIAKGTNVTLDSNKFKAQFGKGTYQGEQFLLVKPQTFMNLSGEAIRPIIDYYKIDLSDCIVLYDDLDIDVGTIRLRQTGSAGGHNGIKSTIQHLGTKEFQRIRIGVGRPQNNIPIVKYVLQRFSEDEQPTMNKVIQHSSDACLSFIEGMKFSDVMSRYNGVVD